MITLSERMEQDNIRIVWGEDDDVTEIIGTENWTGAGISYKWRVVLASDINASTAEVTYYNSVNAAYARPDVSDVFYSMLMDAKSVEDASDFIAWGREGHGFSDEEKKSDTALWDAIERAHETYEACKKDAEKLRTFLGDKYNAYLYETEIDV